MARVRPVHVRTLALLSIVVGLAVLLPLLPAHAATVTVRITSTLSPKSLTIARGTTVRWRNDDDERHRVRRPPPGGSPSSAAVTIGDRVYTPRSVTIATGGTVRWTNRDRDAHTVTARGGGFDSGILSSGGTFSRRFPTVRRPGRHCRAAARPPPPRSTSLTVGPADRRRRPVATRQAREERL